RDLHRRYIRQCLDNFAANANVIQFTSAEFTGPRHFVEFWLDTIAEWEREHVAAGMLPAVEPGVPPGGKGAGGKENINNLSATGDSSINPGDRMPPFTAGRMPAATQIGR